MEPEKTEDKSIVALATPSRNKIVQAKTSPNFSFSFRREHSLELSPAAKSLMQEKRAEVAKIKDQMKSRTGAEDTASALSRKIATPKSQRSRFSDVHNAAFQKMDSIAGHASAFRKDPSHATPLTKPTSEHSGTRQVHSGFGMADKKITSVKRMAASGHSPVLGKSPQIVQAKRSQAEMQDESPSPRKRVKLLTGDTLTGQHTMTPTKEPLPQSSVKSFKPSAIPAPALVHLSSKSENAKHFVDAQISQSPVRAPIFGSLKSGESLLARSPTRAVITESTNHSVSRFSNKLLECSPSKGFPVSDEVMATASLTPPQRLMMRTPTKRTGTISSNTDKASIGDRFKLLHRSPVKSILRTPQRLYSNDPAKVAAGTHLSTPQKDDHRVPATAPVRKHVDFSSSTKAREADKTASMSPASISKPVSYPSLDNVSYPSLESLTAAPVSPTRRRQSSVPRDFTFRAGAEIVFAPAPAPFEPVSPSPKDVSFTIRHVSSEPKEAEIDLHTSTSKKRKIDFENAVSVAAVDSSPTVTLGSKKRKFDFENDLAEKQASHGEVNKENIEDQGRAIKRFKITPAHPTGQPAANAAKKRTTLGVKPKHEIRKSPEKTQPKKGATTISMSRLNALAMPKKR